jgi:hypothetical protein
MTGQRIGSLVGAVFGLVYVVVNAGPLPSAAGLVVRLVGVLAFVVVVAALVRHRDAPEPAPTGDNRQLARTFGLVTLAESVALVAGLVVVNGLLDQPRLGVAWVSVVVGVHFFALAVLFGLRFFHLLGVAITACGVAGFGLAAFGADAAPIAVVSGIVPGAVLLGFGWWGASARWPVDSGAAGRS